MESSRLIYRGNTIVENRGEKVLIRSGRRQTEIPGGRVSAEDVRETIARLQSSPRSVRAEEPIVRLLGRLGAITTTTGRFEHLPGWPYILRHAASPDAAMSRLMTWRIDWDASDATDEDRSTIARVWDMFVDPGEAKAARNSAVVARVSGGGGLAHASSVTPTLILDQRSSRHAPAQALVSRDVGAHARYLRLLRSTGSRDLAERSDPSPRNSLLAALGSVLLVDDLSGIHRLRNAYTITDDLEVRNVACAGFAEHAALQRTASDPTATDASVVDALVVESHTDARLRFDIDLDTVHGTPNAVVRWQLGRQRRETRATGTSLATAAVEAIALSVARSLRVAGWSTSRVSVGSAQVITGASHGPWRAIDTRALLGSALIVVEVPR